MELRSALKKLGEVQARHASIIFALATVFTAFMLLGVPQIRMQTDLSKELPEGVPVLELRDKVAEKFEDTDKFMILIEVDSESQNENRVVDIRDPRVTWMVQELHDLLSKETDITEVISISSPNVRGLYNKDYTATVMYALADVGASEEKTKEFATTVEEDIDSVPLPPGIKMRITGVPMMRTTMMDLLVRDAAFTIAMAALIILALLLLMHRPITRGLLVFFPLTGALIWTLGTMGWLNIPLSLATVGVGAMILGLGVEYGVFIVSRYEEERNAGKNQYDALTTVMPGVGPAIFGSASTTIAAFLALLLATMPMIQHMGATLALGIFYCFIAAMVVNPAFIVLEENFMERRVRLSNAE